MAEFLTTHGTAFQLEKLIIQAKRELVLISPYWQISEQFYSRLIEANDRRVKIKLVYGKSDLKKQEKDKLTDLNKLRLYYLENLHAKCYYNEQHMVITSMNMYEYSEKTNREMGVLINAVDDKQVYDSAVQEAQSFIQSAQEIREKPNFGFGFVSHQPPVQTFQPKQNYNNAPGYCIRCTVPIHYDPAKPYCRDCYDTWAQFENYDYIEKVCHHCGRNEPTSMNKPQCQSCFNSTRKQNYHYR